MELLTVDTCNRTATAIRMTTCVAGVCAALLLVTGCHQSRTGELAADLPTDDSAGLIMYIANQPFITAEPAYRVTYLLAHDESFEGDFDELTATMKAEGLVAKHWQYMPGTRLTRGDVGLLICRACEINTGVNWLLTGLGRYAWRELTFKRIAAGGSDTSLMSGGEFVGIITRAEDYLAETGKRGVEPTKLQRPS
jgi:hypothetical protein